MEPRRRRLLLIALSSVLLIVLLAGVLVHLPAVQQQAWGRVAAAVAEASGLEVAADRVRFRLWPAQAVATGITVSGPQGVFLTVGRLEARWSWWRLLERPHRLELLAVDTLDFDVRKLSLPDAESPPEPATDPWQLLEVETLRVSDGGVVHEDFGVGVEAAGLRIAGSLVDGRAELTLTARQLTATRDGRRLGAGPLEVAAAATSRRVDVHRVDLSGGSLAARASGELEIEGPLGGAVRFELGADLGELAAWWDPNLASGLAPSGRLDLEGEAVWPPGGEPRFELSHRGEPLSVAGFPLEELRVAYDSGGPILEAAAAAWGRVSVAPREDGAADVALNLDRARVDRLLAFAAPQVAAVVPGPATVSGSLEATVSFPVDPATLAARFDLAGRWRDGRIAVVGHGEGSSWTLERVLGEAYGIRLEASGSTSSDGAVSGGLQLSVPAPDETLAALAPQLAGLELPAVGGGPLEVTAVLGGSLSRPRARVEGVWENPEIAGRGFDRAAVTADGDLEELQWTLDAVAVPGTQLGAAGTAAMSPRRVAGTWRLTIADLETLSEALIDEGTLPELQGRIDGEGSFEVSVDSVRGSAAVRASGLEAAGWTVDAARLALSADRETVEVHDLVVDAMGGRIEGSGAVDLGARRLEGALSWRGIDLGSLPLELPPAALGRSAGSMQASGSLESPEAVAEVLWEPTGGETLVERVLLRAEILDGRLEVAGEELTTAFGEVELAAGVPLGGLDLPEGLWPGAPSGPVHVTLRLEDFDSRALVAATGAADPGFDATAVLGAELWLDPQRPDAMRASARVDDLQLRVPGGVLVADGPLDVEVDGGRLEIAPFVLEGLDSRFELEAAYMPASEQLAARIHAQVSPQLARVVPVPLRVRGPLVVDVQLHAPVAAGLNLDSLRGSLVVDHRGGSMVMRDPAVEVRDLQLTARLIGRGLDIVDGSATVNGGRVELGGGWDPASRQGVVVSLDNVAFLAGGILTTWDGQLAVEPLPERLAEVAGELTLRRGVWEENVDLAAVVLGGDELVLAVDDPLHDIALDVSVHGRTGIEVANNLGRFNASWTTLRVGGTAAEPRIRGEVRIAPGGTLALGGQEVKVGRGSVRFTGDPTIDPILEIVPESDLALLEGFDPTVAATRSLAQGITTALGFDNTTLRPEEIAVQTQRDPSSRFLVAKRLSRDLALFFATDLSNVQDRTTMLQAWNFPWLRGLVLQAYQETLTDEVGGNVLQRFRWGGSAGAADRPQIFRLRFEGEWPLGGRTLRRATGLRRGQLYDPFLAFVASVRLERELAAIGYQEAVVISRVEGSERAPTIIFTADPGPNVRLEFGGIDPGTTLRREATALYSPPPLEAASFEAIRGLVQRQLAAGGYPHATVAVGRAGDVVEVKVERGERLELRGPTLQGMPPDGQHLLGQTLRSPAALAAMLRRPDWAARAVERELAVHGYLEAEVGKVEEVPLAPGVAEVRVEVAPGPRAVIGEVAVSGEDPAGLVAEGALRVRAGDPLDRRAIERAVRELRERYEDLGFRAAAAQWTVREGEGGWLVEVALVPGQQRALREVRFDGTRHTSPRVLATGLTVDPGELLTDRDIDVSASRIASFDTVERIEVRAVPVGTSEVDLEFDVSERPRWRAEVGGGWSSERGVSATFGISDSGLLGRGIGLDLRGSWSSPDRRIFLVGSIPATPGGRLSFISTLGYREGDATDEPELLAQEEVLASLEAQYQLRANTQVGLYYRWTDTRTFEKEPDPFNPVPVDVTVGLGLLGGRLVINRFDDLFDPRSGWGFTTDLGWSTSALASDFDYLTSLSNLTLVLEPYAGATWVQSLRVGAAEPLKDQNLIREARFFAGGQASLRGFDLDSVGPVTFGMDFSLVPAGGGALFILNEELRIPVWGSLRAALFADLGQVWESWSEADTDLSVGVGLGIRWSTPIGPLWADVAWPVANVGISSDKPKFYLGIGRPF